MARCVIIGAGEMDKDFLDRFLFLADDFIICADGGYLHAQKSAVAVHLFIGDRDSFTGAIGKDVPCIFSRPEKDDSDMMLALKEGLARGFDEFVLLGATGGRLEHTLANIQTAAYGLVHGSRVRIKDAHHEIFLLKNQSCRVQKDEWDYLSLISFGESCRGVCITGVKYPLDEAVLTNHFPLGLSNAFVEEWAEITVADGVLLVVLSKGL